MPIHDRPMGARATMPSMSHNRSPRDGGHGWKNDGGMNSNKGDLRYKIMQSYEKHYGMCMFCFLHELKAIFFFVFFCICNAGLNRGPMRMRTERPGRDGPGPSLRGGSSSSRGRSSFNERDSRPMVMSNQVSLPSF